MTVIYSCLLLMTLLAIIGSHLGDAGLRDVVVQSEVISEGSIDSVLSGKHYNRAVILHNIMYEAIAQLLVHDIESSLCENDLEMLNEQKTQVEQLKLNLCQEEMEKILKSNLLQPWENRFQEHVAGIKQNSQSFG